MVSNDIVIESTWGLGEAIASGIVTPDIFVINRDGKVVEKDQLKQKERILSLEMVKIL